jgi:hypothetical protein
VLFESIRFSLIRRSSNHLAGRSSADRLLILATLSLCYLGFSLGLPEKLSRELSVVCSFGAIFFLTVSYLYFVVLIPREEVHNFS